MRNKLVSVIVPIYNVEKKLKRCLDSLSNQTYKNIEVLLINDGSNDDSETICMEYEKRGFKYFKKENRGVSSARNFGILNAKGEYIYFIDSDDYCEVNLIEQMIVRTKQNIELCACGYYIEYPNSSLTIDKSCEEKENINIGEFVSLLDEKGMLNVVWNKLYSLEIIKKNKLFFDESMVSGEDLIFNCDYLNYAKRCSIINEKLYHYMREDDITLVNKYDITLLGNIEYFIKKKKKLLINSNVDNEYCIINISNTAFSYSFSCVTNLYRVENTLKKKNKIESLKKIIEICNENDCLKHSNLKNCNSHYKLFYWLVKLNSPSLMFYVYTPLFYLRHKLSKLYLKYRYRILLKNKN